MNSANDSNTTKTGARPPCHAKHTGNRKPHQCTKRKLPYEEIQRLHRQGLTGAAIARELGLKRSSVSAVLRKTGLRTGRHKREVLPDGKIRCSICKKSKEATQFPRTGSHCSHCQYVRMAKQSNLNFDEAIRIRRVWIQNRAKRLHVRFELTDEQLAEMYASQGGLCEYCKKPMVMKLGCGRNQHSASLERIIPGSAYTLKVCLWVHFICNCRRNRLTGEKLKARFPEASEAIERVKIERQLELPFPTDSQITVTNDPEPRPATAQENPTQ